MPHKDRLREKLRRYCLFLEWQRANNRRLLSIAYQLFVKETGITIEGGD